MSRITRIKTPNLFHKVLISVIIIAIIAGCFYIIERITDRDKQKQSETELSKGEKTDSKPKEKIDLESYRYISSRAIDSILYNFGIKKDEILTNFTGEKKKPEKVFRDKVLWYTKIAEIPKKLNTTEINLELTGYLRNIGLSPVVTEDIKSNNITFTVYNDTSNSSPPLIKIFINHGDKINK